MDEALASRVIKTKKKAQVTVVEHQLLRGLQAYAGGDMVNGEDDINAQIKSFGPGKIKSAELCKGLWNLCFKATRGHQV